MSIIFKEGGIELIDEIQETWEALNLHHQEKSVYFKERFKKFTFFERRELLTSKAKNGEIFVIIAFSNDERVGHCVSSIDNKRDGEIETLFIKKKFRKTGLGKILMEKSLSWFSSKQIENINIMVASGNEEVLTFYKKYGFEIAGIKLKKTD
ncbi:MAG: hypothetical protein PWQ77_489 [Kosmotogales bacterium]|nr:hypothetical protein [Kosmotogales bacterium]